MLDLNELQKIIDSQTRNGRKQVYLPVSTMKELGVTYNTQDERVFVDVDKLQDLISTYKKDSFRNSLKVDVTPVTHNTISTNKKQQEREL